jgi:hypothetical protein
MQKTVQSTEASKMDRRAFLRLGMLATAGIAVWLCGCSAPAKEEVAAVAQDPRQRGTATVKSTAAAPTELPVQPAERIATPTAAPAVEPGGVACPFLLLNDPYPGRSKRYTDRNGSGVCDYSEPGSGDRTPIIAA